MKKSFLLAVAVLTATIITANISNARPSPAAVAKLIAHIHKTSK
ncbi:MAG: hypothetical protein QM529_00200 [Hydrotalea sp.]|nr:hypothetical protein [Hydrotalea sp.]